MLADAYVVVDLVSLEAPWLECPGFGPLLVSLLPSGLVVGSEGERGQPTHVLADHLPPRADREAAFVEVDDDVHAAEVARLVRDLRAAGYDPVVVVAAPRAAGFGTERRRRQVR